MRDIDGNPIVLDIQAPAARRRSDTLSQSKQDITKKNIRDWFFAIDAEVWPQVCALGINEAVAYLVMACGSSRDQRTTEWSCTAVQKYGGITIRRHAEAAVNRLIKSGVVKKTRGGTKPRYKLKARLKQRIWLPNAIVTSAAGEKPPIFRIRQTGDSTILRLYCQLYKEHDLFGLGGIDLDRYHVPCAREYLGERGEWVIWGFSEPMTAHTCLPDSPPDEFFSRFHILGNLGLWEKVVGVFDGDWHEGQPLCMIRGDDLANKVGEAAAEAARELMVSMDQGVLGRGVANKDQANYYVQQFRRHDLPGSYVLPIPAHFKNPHVICFARLRYRPKTKATTRWFARYAQVSENYLKRFQEVALKELAARTFKLAVNL